jgi:hypothetical protein
MRREWTVSICAVMAVFALLATEASASGSASQPIRRPQEMQRRHFRIFRSAPEQLPASIEGSIGTFAGHGFNPALAQRAQPPHGRRALWVVPGRGQILLAQQLSHGEAIVTATTWSAIQRGITFTFVPTGDTAGIEGKHPPDNTRAVGLVPDGVTAVKLTGRLVAPVRNNVFSIDIGTTRVIGPPVLIESG